MLSCSTGNTKDVQQEPHMCYNADGNTSSPHAIRNVSTHKVLQIWTDQIEITRIGAKDQELMTNNTLTLQSLHIYKVY